MLRHATQGDQLLELRKQQAFKNWTVRFASPQLFDVDHN